MTDAITEHAVNMLNAQQNQDKPFFLYVAYTAPHWPLQAPAEEIVKYQGKYNMGWDSLRASRYEKERELGILGSESKFSPRDPDVEAWDTVSAKRKNEMSAKMAVYAAQIDRLDQGIGKILDKLDAIGKKENTMVIFLSDNGGCAETGIWGFDRRKNGLPPGGVDSYMSYGQSWANASNTPFRFFKKWLHEGGISTPLIIRWPAAIPKERDGQIIKQVAHIIDVMPTFCELTGARYPKKFNGKNILPFEGQSLVPEIENGQVQSHKPLYWPLNGHKAILLGDYKLEATSDTSSWELYNIQIDRSELNNIAGEYPDRVKSMANMWRKWADKVGVFKGRTEKQRE